MASLEIEAQDVIKVILQFCRENNLTQSFQAMSAECQVSLNTVDNLETFTGDIAAGRWDVVLPQVAQLQLPRGKMEDLYEQVVLEMVELRELDTARALLRQSAVLSALKVDDPERYLKLEHLVNRPYFEAADAWPAPGGRDARRRALAAAVAADVAVVPSSRLLALVGQALKWQQHTGALPPGTEFDLFRAAAPARRDELEAHPTVEAKCIRFGKKSHAEVASFSPDGQFLVTGSSDGFIEVWDAGTGKLRTDLPYQKEEAFMMHDAAVLALAVSLDSELLASGASDGSLKVWKLRNGACVRRYPAAHGGGVTSAAFSRDGSHVLTASFDGAARVHGLKSGKLLKDLRGHASFVNAAAYTADESRILTAGADGTLRIWDARTGEPGAVIRAPGAGPAAAPPPLLAVVPLPGVASADVALLCGRRGAMWLLSLASGAVVASLPHSRGDAATSAAAGAASRDFCSAAVSPRGEFAYGLCADGVLCAFPLPGAAGVPPAGGAHLRPVHTLRAHDGDALGIAVHPHRNLVATFAGDGTLRLWKP